MVHHLRRNDAIQTANQGNGHVHAIESKATVHLVQHNAPHVVAQRSELLVDEIVAHGANALLSSLLLLLHLVHANLEARLARDSCRSDQANAMQLACRE
eukprot:CAMPEP_0206128366 /NCGR_PEP_ID=MMETSP1472-20131121/31793_1 /ASSEMBLY_ACC=CAM_ASM_001108 /TAXON_ID=41880 /ORGANISM="Pycnococcus provasolii, Strain RCC251" /LENGTH=98 /DNA_ID=CAMNT_0053519557 /DNA_START=130 /DNA_END=426 /DNA_ORIENTATION=+